MRQLTEKDISTLKSSGRVLEGETVLLEGDIVVAVNAQTGMRRVVDTSGLMLEGTRKLLLD